MAKKIVFISLTVLLGLVFLLSAFTKLYPIEPFEYTFVDLGILNWQMAPFAARIIISLEFIIGVLLIFQINLKKITYKLAIGILIFFSIYLLAQIIFVGNKGNCGCFGTYFQMSPLQALIKNIAMLGILFLLNKYHIGWQIAKKYNFYIWASALGIASLPFIWNYVELDYSQAYLDKPENNFKLELDSLYKDATLNIPPKTLSKDKHVIAFMSLTCPHCRIAANKIRIMHELNPNISFYFVLNGEGKNLQAFFEETKSDSIPHCILNGKNFMYLAGVYMPAIYLVNNSIVEHKVNYMDLNQDEIEKWMGISN